jgi:hypothetical protein
LFTTGYDKDSDNSCVTLEEWLGLVKTMAFVDTIQTIIIPFIIIAFLNVLIGFRLLKNFTENRNRPRSNSIAIIDLIEDENALYFSIPIIRNSSIIRCENGTRHKQLRKRFRSRFRLGSKKEAIALFIIVTIFLLLNFPITINKVMNFFTKNYSNIDANDFYKELNLIRNINNNNDSNSSNMNSNLNYTYDDANFTFEIKLENTNQTVLVESPEQIKIIQIREIRTKLSSFIYYINFSINFFLYTFNTKQFRENFLHIFKK